MMDRLIREINIIGCKLWGASNIPYGFTLDASGKLVHEPDEQENIRLMHELMREGYSRREIFAELKRYGIIL